jgi:hypothetical protein
MIHDSHEVSLTRRVKNVSNWISVSIFPTYTVSVVVRLFFRIPTLQLGSEFKCSKPRLHEVMATLKRPSQFIFDWNKENNIYVGGYLIYVF